MHAFRFPVLCQVKSAADYVRDANTDIETAITSAKSIRKRQCCLLVIVLVVLAVIAIVVVVMMGN